MRSMLLILALTAVNMFAQAEAASVTWVSKNLENTGSIGGESSVSATADTVTGSVDFTDAGGTLDKNFTHTWTFNVGKNSNVRSSLIEFYEEDMKINSVKLDGADFGSTVSAEGIRHWSLTSSLLAGNHTVSILFDEIFNASAQYDLKIKNLGETSEVPVPAAVWLFGSALAGMIGLRRRNNV